MCGSGHSEFLLDEELEQELKKPPRETLEQARVFVDFACRCLRGTPVGGGKMAADLLTDPRLRTAVEAAETWVRAGAGVRLAAVIDAALSAADEPTEVREKTAAEAAATAVWAAGDAGHVPSLGANLAAAAAAKARRAAAAVHRDALRFQWELARQLWPGHVRDFPATALSEERGAEASAPPWPLPDGAANGFPIGLQH